MNEDYHAMIRLQRRFLANMEARNFPPDELECVKATIRCLERAAVCQEITNEMRKEMPT